MNGDAGKGDKRRPCDQARYDRNYIAIFGKDCIHCGGLGKTVKAGYADTWEGCFFCKGLGRVDRYAR